jgi:predicted ATPase
VIFASVSEVSVLNREQEYQPQIVARKHDQFVVLSGCSGGGKSSLLAELGRRGYAIYEEPGRQVVKEQLLIGGDALPWGNLDLFLELTISRSIHHLVEAARSGTIAFFDRGIIDQVNGYRARGMEIPKHLLGAVEHFRYRETVFVVPPWREIFANDAERRHSFDESVAAYEALVETYKYFGYRPLIVPKADMATRADFVLAEL